MVYEVDRISSCMFAADFECSDVRSVVNGGIFEAADLFATTADEGHELSCADYQGFPWPLDSLF